MDEEDSSFSDEVDDEDSPSSNAAQEPEIPEEMREMYDAMMAGPPVWVTVGNWIIGSLLALVLAITIMVQWGLWFALTMQFLNGWGGIVGGLICAVQIVIFFGSKKEAATSCEIPRT